MRTLASLKRQRTQNHFFERKQQNNNPRKHKTTMSARPMAAVVAAKESEEDIQNMEHSGDWDHGSEPIPPAGAAEETTGDTDDPNSKIDRLGGAKKMMQQAQVTVSKVIHDLGEKADQALHHDSHFKEEVEGHTEEEVAGCKLAVSKNIHQDSFSAP
jgi:hypothetical protein